MNERREGSRKIRGKKHEQRAENASSKNINKGFEPIVQLTIYPNTTTTTRVSSPVLPHRFLLGVPGTFLGVAGATPVNLLSCALSLPSPPVPLPPPPPPPIPIALALALCASFAALLAASPICCGGLLISTLDNALNISL